MRSLCMLLLCLTAAICAEDNRVPKRIRIAPISLLWEKEGRTLDAVLRALDEVGASGADLACLPQECVLQAGEPIPGPLANAIAQKAAQHKMYVVGNLREKDGDKTYITSFLCDRAGKIIGKYRKTHRLPSEQDFELGVELPLFQTDFGVIAMKVGSDHYFSDIDAIYRARNARLVVWSTLALATRDEHMETLPLQGRASQFKLFYAVARYAGKEGYGGYKDQFSWLASWPLGRAQVFDLDGHTIADSGHGGGAAVATIPATQLNSAGINLGGGYPADGTFALLTAKDLPASQPRTPNMKRTIKAAAIECEYNYDKLIEKIDHCGKQGCDIVCLWEYVWYANDDEVEKYKARNRALLARIADAAKRNKLYVVIAGELERGFNEAIIWDREGKELPRYTKIFQTTEKTSKYYRCGDKVGIYDLDFGRVCVKICADVYTPEIDRVAALHQVDLVLHPTQDAGPFNEHIRLREAHRCLDHGYYYVRASAQAEQSDHRAYIMDPWGVVLAASQLHTPNEPVIATLQLDNRPKYFEFPDEVLKAGPHPDPYQRNLRPAAKGDWRAVLLRQRRPELYLPVVKAAP